MKKIYANIGYNDKQLKKWVDKGADLVTLYKEAGIELTDERIELLLSGNDTSDNEPFIKVIEDKAKVIETAEKKNEDVEVAVKGKGRKVSKKSEE